MKHIVRQHLRHKVLVTLKDGQAFSGVLFDADSEAVLLRNAEALGAGDRGTNVTLDGEVLMLRQEIAFIQIP